LSLTKNVYIAKITKNNRNKQDISIPKITNTKNKPIKPKNSSTKNSEREKTMIFIEKKHQTPSWKSPSF
jgi:hypothetical protein